MVMAVRSKTGWLALAAPVVDSSLNYPAHPGLPTPALQTAKSAAVADPASNTSPEIVVIHTRPIETLNALKMAAGLADGLAPVRLLAAQVVPYPLDLYAPPVSIEFLESNFMKMVSEAAVSATVDIRLGRDVRDVIEAGLSPHSVVVIGGRRQWWPTAAMRLARRLERLGHQVVFTN
jgi:hypothetical protein